MPIKAEFRHLYSGPKWQATRARILDRDGHKCKICRVPDRLLIARIDKYRGWWFTLDGQAYNWRGVLEFEFRGSEFDAPDRIITIVLTVAHLNQVPGDDRDENLAALCQFHHLNHDRLVNLAQAKETRLDHKDAGRPMLGVAL